MANTCIATWGITAKELITDGHGSSQDNQVVADTLTFVDAAGALGVTAQWKDSRTLTGTESLDLAGGVTNRFGAAKTFTKNKVFYVKNTSESGTITVGGGSNPFVGWFTGTIVLAAGEIMSFGSPTASGKAVVAGTGDLVQVVASVSSMTYDIVILGE